MQVRGVVDGVTVIDDFAHHPTKVRETVRAVRARYPRSHLVAVFEPRTTTSRRKVFQEAYPASFAAADEVVVVPPFDAEKIPEAERFDSAALVAALQRNGQKAVLHAERRRGGGGPVRPAEPGHGGPDHVQRGLRQHPREAAVGAAGPPGMKR